MKCKACWLFWSAFLGALMMYALLIAARYRLDPTGFLIPDFGAIIAQVTISLIVTAFTFMSVWREVTAEKHHEQWQPYVKAIKDSALLECILIILQGN